jgi:hypothetical protein
MPIQINYVSEGIGVEYIYSGVVTGRDIIDANDITHQRETLQRLRYKLVDRTGCTEYRVTFDEMRMIATQDIQAARINPRFMIALVSPTNLQFGMSRMWHAFIEDSGLQSGLFKDRKNADAWISEKHKDHE